MFCMPQAWSCSASSRAGSHSSSCTSSHHCGLSVKTSTRMTKGSLINKLQHWLSFIVFGSVWSIYKVVSGSFLTNVTKKSLWKLVPEFPWRCVFQICLRSCDCFVVMRCLLEEEGTIGDSGGKKVYFKCEIIFTLQSRQRGGSDI